MPSRVSVDLSYGSSSALAPVSSSTKSSLAPTGQQLEHSTSTSASASSPLSVAPITPMTKHKEFVDVNTRAERLPTDSAFSDAQQQKQQQLYDPQQQQQQPSKVIDTDMEVDSNNDSEDNGAETDSTSNSHSSGSHPHSHPTTPEQSAYFCFGDRCYASSDPDTFSTIVSPSPIDGHKGKGKHITATEVVSPLSDTHSKNSSLPSITSLVSIDEAEDEAESDDSHDAKGKSKGKGKGKESSEFGTASTSALGSSSSAGSSSKKSPVPSLPRLASAHYTPYTNGSSSNAGESSSKAAGSSSSKPSLARATTSPPTVHQPSSSSSSSSSSAAVAAAAATAGASSSSSPSSSSTVVPAPTAPTAPTEPKLSERTFTQEDLIAYEDLPKDFDFGGDLPFYDIDPRTGVIYGDPHAVMRQFLCPDACFDQYQFEHDANDPKKINIFNKHGALIYYYPGRMIGNDQDSIRCLTVAGPLWTISGRISTWNTLTATDPTNHRQIRIVMEGPKKSRPSKDNVVSANSAPTPLNRFVFRWKESDCVVEYRKQKDQYRITVSEMCGGTSKWKPPSAFRPVQTFHGEGMEGNALAQSNAQLGTPSPFDATRYLQQLSEFRVQSGPVRKEGVFELYNPDTMPVEFRTFLMLVSLVVLEIVRPVDEKAMIKEFPNLVIANRHRMALTGGMRANSAAAMASIGTPGMAAATMRPQNPTALISMPTAPLISSTATFCRPPPDYFSVPSATDPTTTTTTTTATTTFSVPSSTSSPSVSNSGSASVSTKSLPDTMTSTSSTTPSAVAPVSIPPASVATKVTPSTQVSSSPPSSKNKPKKKWGFFSRK
ncbi:hypothetical protein BGW41_000927 [Actinomortierella wolfii]|nr:hypothetical protein BGW41_000927 [Actinomortierella wolfii]